jgi:DNA-binding NarL/FixJ family response regulator
MGFSDASLKYEVCGGKGTSVMKILVVDDHVLIRQALHGVLKKLRRDAVLFEAPNSESAMQILTENPDLRLILLDLNLPDRDGFSVLSEIRERYPSIAVVVLSGAQDSPCVMKALDLGALGYIPKSAQSDVMVNALRLVMSGGLYIPPQALNHEVPHDIGRPSAHELHGSPEYLGLTERQLDVLGLMMQGNSNKTICRILNLAEPTVKNHVTAILKTLNVSNRTEAVVAASNLGWKLRVPQKH